MKKILLFWLLAFGYTTSNWAFAFSEEYLQTPRPIYFNVVRKLILEQPHAFTTTYQGNAITKKAQFIKDEDTRYLITLTHYSNGTYEGTLIRIQGTLTPINIRLSGDEARELFSLLENMEKTIL